MKTFLIDCDRVSQRKRDHEIHLDQDHRTRRPSPRREKREGAWTGGRCATRIVHWTHVRAREAAARRITSCRFAESTPGSTGSKISDPGMAPPPSPYMATSRAYSATSKKREREWEKEREKKGNNNNRSLPGTSWSRAWSSSWNSPTYDQNALL